MSFLPRFAAGEFAPLFRLLDDYEGHLSNRSGVSQVRSFAPKFDVKEVKDAYHLDGELPGIEQKDIQIEFTDPHTLIVKGRTEREYSSGTPPASLEGSGSQGAIEAAPEGTNTPKSHKATVEDEDAPANGESTAVQKAAAKDTSATPQHRYWVSERSVGEFHRAFTFPTRVDQDAVKASLKNGILSIVVPKATAPTSKKITIE